MFILLLLQGCGPVSVEACAAYGYDAGMWDCEHYENHSNVVDRISDDACRDAWEAGYEEAFVDCNGDSMPVWLAEAASPA